MARRHRVGGAERSLNSPFMWGMMFLSVLLLILLPRSVDGQECNTAGLCDSNKNCTLWASLGECQKNPDYMWTNCIVSCRNHQETKLTSTATAITATEQQQAQTTTSSCVDQHARCSIWRSLGECDRFNNHDVFRLCPKTCHRCSEAMEIPRDQIICQDTNASCLIWASQGECEYNPGYMHISCAKSCDTCSQYFVARRQQATREDTVREKSNMFGVQQVIPNLETLQLVERSYARYGSLRDGKCVNTNEMCSYWASLGECENNPNFMLAGCGPACFSC